MLIVDHQVSFPYISPTLYRSYHTASPVRNGTATPDQLIAFRDAQSSFRTTASHDALYLVLIGLGACIATYIYMLIVSRFYLKNWLSKRNAQLQQMH